MTSRPTYFTPGIHVLIWASLLAIPAFIIRDASANTGLPGLFFLAANIYNIGLFYFNAYFLFPRLFTRKKGWLYLLSLVAIFFFSYYAKIFLLTLADPQFTENATNHRFIFYPPIAFLAASFIYRFIADRIAFEKIEEERKAERLASELKFLRSQISPHFLFNIMANMVSMARQKSDQLESSLIRLSDLLRYMLYESAEEKFPVSKEILYLKNYIELQQLRFGEDLSLRLDISGEADDCTIEPMLLVPFVENAFKHGVGLVEKPYIDIVLQIKGQQLSFVVANNYSNRDLSKDKSHGIGLENVRNRLKLLYPDKYKLVIDDNGGIYTVKLNIDLTC